MVLAVITTALLLLVVLAATALVREVKEDGYGHRPAPLSHEGWGVASMPSAPYRANAAR
jgi:hypothetical protein